MVRDFSELFDTEYFDWYLKEVRGMGGLLPYENKNGENIVELDILFVGHQKDRNNFAAEGDLEPLCYNTDEETTWTFFGNKVFR